MYVFDLSLMALYIYLSFFCISLSVYVYKWTEGFIYAYLFKRHVYMRMCVYVSAIHSIDFERIYTGRSSGSCPTKAGEVHGTIADRDIYIYMYI